jgi:hypothetical protein
MSTRACYRFFPLNGPNDWPGVVTVYKHRDGYPSGAAKAIEAALPTRGPFLVSSPTSSQLPLSAATRSRPKTSLVNTKRKRRRQPTRISPTSWTRPRNTGPTQDIAAVAAETSASFLTKVSTVTSVSPVTSPTSTMFGAGTERSASPRTPRVNATTSGPSRNSSKAQSLSSNGASPSHVVPLSSS